MREIEILGKAECCSFPKAVSTLTTDPTKAATGGVFGETGGRGMQSGCQFIVKNCRL